MLYAADGSFNVSVVNGLTRTGIQAADGSYNVVQVDGTVYTGLYHPCGGYNVFKAIAGPTHHACGAYNVSTSPYVDGTMKVTVVSGALT